MAIFNRLTRLFTADVHAVLDRLEEPEALLRQALREMESAVAEQSRQLRGLEAERQQQQVRRTELERELSSIAEELDLCFDGGNEQLVRSCLRRRLRAQRQQQLIDQRLQRLSTELEQLGASLNARNGQLENLRERAALLDLDATRTDDAHRTHGADTSSVCEEEVDLAYLRERQTRSGS